MRITPVSEHVGAEVTEVDLRVIDDGTAAELDRAWGEHAPCSSENKT